MHPEYIYTAQLALQQLSRHAKQGQPPFTELHFTPGDTHSDTPIAYCMSFWEFSDSLIFLCNASLKRHGKIASNSLGCTCFHNFHLSETVLSKCYVPQPHKLWSHVCSLRLWWLWLDHSACQGSTQSDPSCTSPPHLPTIPMTLESEK